MLKIVDDVWLVDTEALLCSNSLTQIVVKLQKSENIYIGKIKDMPMELTVRLAKMKDGEKFLEKAVFKAEEIFNREMFEMDKR
jgi:hypothetical protein